MNSRLSFRTTNDHHSHQMFCKVKLGQTAGAVGIEARLVNSLVRLLSLDRDIHVCAIDQILIELSQVVLTRSLTGRCGRTCASHSGAHRKDPHARSFDNGLPTARLRQIHRAPSQWQQRDSLGFGSEPAQGGAWRVYGRSSRSYGTLVRTCWRGKTRHRPVPARICCSISRFL